MTDLPLYQVKLEKVLREGNTTLYLQNDPIRFPKKYNQNIASQEIIAFISALLAYGRVKAIGEAIENILSRFEYEKIADLLCHESMDQIQKRCHGFVYRFTTEQDIFKLLVGLSSLLKEFNHLGQAIQIWHEQKHIHDAENFLPLLSQFRAEILKRSESIKGGPGFNHLLSDTSKKSCCKRWHMFLRWMVRKDEIDLGCWHFLGKHKLLIPVDTHVHRLSLSLGLTQRKNADLQCAKEITLNLAKIAPHDPVKYDFALAHLGISDKIISIDQDE